MSINKNKANAATVTILKRLLRKTRRLPGGGRTDLYSQGYDTAMNDFRKEVKEEIRKIVNPKNPGPKSPRGRKPKLTDEQKQHARYLYYNTACKMSEVAAHFDVSPSTISKLLNAR